MLFLEYACKSIQVQDKPHTHTQNQHLPYCILNEFSEEIKCDTDKPQSSVSKKNRISSTNDQWFENCVGCFGYPDSQKTNNEHHPFYRKNWFAKKAP